MQAVKREDVTDDDSAERTGAARSSTMASAASSGKLRDNDVLFVHGETTLEYPGNAAYRRLISLNKGIYANARSLRDKLQISKSIVASIRQERGRFLEREDESGIITSLRDVKWKEISDAKAKEITLKALRDGHGKAEGPSQPSALTSRPLAPPLPPAPPRPAPEPQRPAPPIEAKPPLDRTLIMKLNPVQASKMKFPIDCPVWYNVTLPPPRGTSKGCSPLGGANVGVVKSISMDISSRDLLYQVSPVKRVEDGGSNAMSSDRMEEEGELYVEAKLCYAPKCPVAVTLDEEMEGEVITCCLSNGWADTSGKKTYMVSVFLSEGKVCIYQAVNENAIKYRALAAGDKIDATETEDKAEEADEDETATGAAQETIHAEQKPEQPLETSKTAPLPKESFQSNEESAGGTSPASSRKRQVPASSLSDGADEGLDSSYQRPSKCAKGDVGDVATNHGRESTTVDGNTTSPSAACRIIQLPPWLVADESSRNEVLNVLNLSIQPISQATGCNIRIDSRPVGNETQIRLVISQHEHSLQKDGRRAIELIENSLVKYIGAEESRGRLLFDTAKSFCDSSYEGAVLQRNPWNSAERIWMAVVDFPSEIIDGDRVVVPVGPLLQTQFHDSVHEAQCNLVICIGNSATRLRCRPYVLILGKQLKNVNHIVALTRRAMTQIVQTKARNQSSLIHGDNVATNQVNHQGQKDEAEGAPHPWASSNAQHPRKVWFPDWLVSDANFQREIAGGLFGSYWCHASQFQDRTGCELQPFPQYVIIQPVRPANLKKATSEIEDALVKFIGACELKCMLLFDLTKSYRQSVDGMIEMNNPLWRAERVWAKIVSLRSVNENCMKLLVAKKTYEEMHKLRCTLKVCSESFGIKMPCHPYVMLMGRQKKNLQTAAIFVDQILARCRPSPQLAARGSDMRHYAPNTRQF